MFNWLMADVAGARCLDLFAGTGALGFEALSRGATHCDFVESQVAAQTQLTSNIDVLDCGDRATLWPGRALDALPRLSGPYDLVFLDPPFAEAMHETALKTLLDHGLLGPDALIYLEYPREEPPDIDASLTVYRQKVAGAVACSLLRYT